MAFFFLDKASWDVERGLSWTGALFIDSGLECLIEFVGEFPTKLSTDRLWISLCLKYAGTFGEIDPEDEFSPKTIK